MKGNWSIVGKKMSASEENCAKKGKTKIDRVEKWPYIKAKRIFIESTAFDKFYRFRYRRGVGIVGKERYDGVGGAHSNRVILLLWLHRICIISTQNHRVGLCCTDNVLLAPKLRREACIDRLSVNEIKSALWHRRPQPSVGS